MQVLNKFKIDGVQINAIDKAKTLDNNVRLYWERIWSNHYPPNDRI